MNLKDECSFSCELEYVYATDFGWLVAFGEQALGKSLSMKRDPKMSQRRSPQNSERESRSLLPL